MAQIIAGGTKPDSGGNVEVITQTQTTTWTQLQGKPYIAVSSKGIVNGLSTIPNDGADFGPDTTKGATAPGQYGSPYTETSGINEGISSLPKILNSQSSNLVPRGTIKLLSSSTNFKISDAIVIYDDWFVGIESDGPPLGLTAPTSIAIIQSNSPSGAIATKVNTAGVSLPGGVISLRNISIFGNAAITTPAGYATYLVCLGSAQTSQPSMINLENVLLNDNSGANGTLGLFSLGGDDLYSLNKVTVSGYTNATSTNGGNSVLKLNGMNHFYGNYIFIDAGPGTVPTSGSFIAASIDFTTGGTWYMGVLHLFGNPNAYLYNRSGGSGSGALISNLFFELQTPPTDYGINAGYRAFWGSATNQVIVDYLAIGGSWNPFTNSGTNINGGLVVKNFSPNIGVNATIPTNPPVSGTVYQNSANLYDIRLKIPVTYSPTSTAAATLATGISSTSTVTTSTKVSIPAGVTTGQILTYEMVVPAGWYYELVATNATIGTVEVQAA